MPMAGVEVLALRVWQSCLAARDGAERHQAKGQVSCPVRWFGVSQFRQSTRDAESRFGNCSRS